MITITRRSFLHVAFTLALALAAAPVSAGESKYLSAGQLDPLRLLPPPAAADTQEGRAELDAASVVHTSASPEMIARAAAETKLTAFSFAPVIGAWFVPEKFPKTEALFKELEAETKAVTDEAKNHFQRPRPYHLAPQRFPRLIEREDQTHYSYPSGHSTRGTLFAAVLAEIFPENRAALLEKGRETGWLRVVGGTHFPSDVFAGRVLGQALTREFLRSDRLRADLTAVRAEVAASGHGSADH